MDRDQFILQVRKQQDALRSYLLALCAGNQADADDIAQESLVKAYLAIDRYRDSGQFKYWLFKIAYNTFLNHVAAKRQYDSIEEAESAVATDSADSGFDYFRGVRGINFPDAVSMLYRHRSPQLSNHISSVHADGSWRFVVMM